MGKKHIYLNLFWSTHTKWFFWDYWQNKIRTKLDYLKNFVTHVDRTPPKFSVTLFKASGLKRHPVQEAQKWNYIPSLRPKPWKPYPVQRHHIGQIRECPPGELFYLAGVFCRTLYTSLQLCRRFLWAHECFASESAMLKLQKRGENEASQKTQYRNQTFTIIIIIVVVVLNIRICSNINLRVTIFTLPNLPSSLYQRWRLQ